jgi:hypothetical protein
MKLVAKLVLSTALACAVGLLACGTAHAQTQTVYDRTQMNLIQAPFDLGVGAGKTLNVAPGGQKVYIHNIAVQAEGLGSHGANIGMEVYVDGEFIGNTFVPVVDPRFHFNISRWGRQITLSATPAPGQDAHTLRVKAVTAVISSNNQPQQPQQPSMPGPWDPIYDTAQHPTCGTCVGLPFPSKGFHSVMGALSNEAVKLVNDLRGFTNYQDFGRYLLPIRKAALESRSVAENLGDASGEARPY